MNTRVKTAENHLGPRKDYYFPIEDIDRKDSITLKQSRILKDLIFQYMFEDDRDRMLDQLPDLTHEEASDLIEEIRYANWR